MTDAQLPARRPAGGALTTAALKIEGLDAHALGLRHPLLRIQHPDGGYRLGEFKGPSIDVVFLRAHRFREFRTGENWNDPIDCASADGVLPLDTITMPKARTCEACPYGNWSDDPTSGKRIPPQCDEGIALLGVWPSGGNLPFWLTFNSYSRIKPTREFLQTILYYNAAAAGRGEEPVKGFYDFAVSLTTEDRRNGGIRWAIPKYESRRMTAEQAAPYRDLYGVARELVYVPEVRGAGETDDIAEEARVAAEAEVVPLSPEEERARENAVPF